jgi:hypothetical protein
MPKQAVYHSEGSCLRNMAKQPDFTCRISPHAEKALKDDGLEGFDLSSSFKACAVVSMELVDGEWQWTTLGRDLDGNQIQAVIIPDTERNDVFVITVWKL